MGIRVLLILALLGCKKAPPTPPTAENAEAPTPADPFSPPNMARWADQIVPLLEKHAERQFERQPAVEVFDPSGYREFLQREAKLVMDAVLKDTPEHVRDQAARAQGGILSVYGKYGIYDHKVFLVPEAITSGAEQAEMPVEDLARIILAHELGHALQHDKVDPSTSFERIVDLDHFHSWHAVSEGGANLLALRVARDLGLEHAFWALTEQQGWNRDGMLSPHAYPVWMAYGRGMKSLEEVVATRGMEGFWAWHDAPPARSSMLFDPSSYDPVVRATAELADALRGTEQLLTRGEWLTSNTRLGAYELRGDALRTGKEEAFDEVFSHLNDAQHLDLDMPGGGRSGDIRILRFDEAQAALDYVGLLRAEQTVEAQFLAKQLGVTVEVSYNEVKGVAGDISLLRTQRVPVGGGSYRETRTAWVARGADIVAVTAVGFRPGLRLANTLNGVFAALEGAPPED